MNPLDFVILAVIAAAIVGALVAVKKHKCGTCHGDCGNCGKSFAVKGNENCCPRCGSQKCKVIEGGEFVIKEIVAK